MHENWLPWESFPDLTLERLSIVAQILRRERDDAAVDHRADRGETEFALGVSAWERTKYALIVTSPNYNWLHIINGVNAGPSHFIFQIGIFPVRFYHGSYEDTPARYLLVSDEEKDALKLEHELAGGHFLRFGIETDAKHRTKNIELIEYDGFGEVVHRFSVPLDATATVTRFTVPQREGVNIAPPTVEVIQLERKQEGEK